MIGKIKVMSIFGTRPEAIKMAPVVMELMRHSDEIETKTLVTAQHREMLDQVLHLFRIVPDYDLNIMAAGQTLFDITTRAMMGINEVFQKDRPDLVLVHGDTTTTFAGALAAYYHQIPVGHVEAGLRTHDIYSPFPEEMNRRLTGGIATLHFAPTATAHDNLAAEGVPERRIFVTGNTVIDALHHTVRPDYMLPPELSQVDFANNRVLLVTTHRRENLGEPMRHRTEKSPTPRHRGSSMPCAPLECFPASASISSYFSASSSSLGKMRMIYSVRDASAPSSGSSSDSLRQAIPSIDNLKHIKSYDEMNGATPYFQKT